MTNAFHMPLPPYSPQRECTYIVRKHSSLSLPIHRQVRQAALSTLPSVLFHRHSVEPFHIASVQLFCNTRAPLSLHHRLKGANRVEPSRADPSRSESSRTEPSRSHHRFPFQTTKHHRSFFTTRQSRLVPLTRHRRFLDNAIHRYSLAFPIDKSPCHIETAYSFSFPTTMHACPVLNHRHPALSR